MADATPGRVRQERGRRERVRRALREGSQERDSERERARERGMESVCSKNKLFPLNFLAGGHTHFTHTRTISTEYHEKSVQWGRECVRERG